MNTFLPRFVTRVFTAATFTLLVGHSLLVGQAHAAIAGNELYKITASDAAMYDSFGTVGISGNMAIVGANGNGDAGRGSGSAYLFDVSTGRQLFKLTASDAAAFDSFGTSVAISGNTAIVGAHRNEDAGSNSGSAYLFDVSTGEELFKLNASDGALDDKFGIATAISGNTAIIGAQANGEPGSAYLFDVSTGEELFKLNASNPAGTDWFGNSVGISGNTAIVGARRDDGFTGAAYLFDVTTGQQLFKLTASDAAAGDVFGISAAISGNVAIVGASANDDAGGSSGSVYLFDVSSGQQLFKLTAADAASADAFGATVAISGNTAIVGAQGDRDAGLDTGSAYLFDVTTGQQLAKLTASDAAAADLFSVVAISGNTAMVGARSDDDSGSVYVFSASPGVLLSLDAAIDPTTINDALDAGTGVRTLTGMDRRYPGTIGILNHPGEMEGNLDMWFVLDGLLDNELEDLAAELRDIDGVLDAQRIALGSGPDFLFDANLMVTFDGGASPGESTAIEYNFGPDVTMTAFAVPEPSTLTLAALTLFGCAARWRRRRRTSQPQATPNRNAY